MLEEICAAAAAITTVDTVDATRAPVVWPSSVLVTVLLVLTVFGLLHWSVVQQVKPRASRATLAVAMAASIALAYTFGEKRMLYSDA